MSTSRRKIKSARRRSLGTRNYELRKEMKKTDNGTGNAKTILGRSRGSTISFGKTTSRASLQQSPKQDFGIRAQLRLVQYQKDSIKKRLEESEIERDEALRHESKLLARVELFKRKEKALKRERDQAYELLRKHGIEIPPPSPKRASHHIKARSADDLEAMQLRNRQRLGLLDPEEEKALYKAEQKLKNKKQLEKIAREKKVCKAKVDSVEALDMMQKSFDMIDEACDMMKGLSATTDSMKKSSKICKDRMETAVGA